MLQEQKIYIAELKKDNEMLTECKCSLEKETEEVKGESRFLLQQVIDLKKQLDE